MAKEISTPPPQKNGRSLEILGRWGGGGSQNPKLFLKESMKPNLNFQRDWGVGVKPSNFPWERYGYFLRQHIKFVGF